MVWEKQVEGCGHINLRTRFTGLTALDHGIECESSYTSISEELKGGDGFREFSDANAESGIILGGMLKFLIFVLGFGALSYTLKMRIRKENTKEEKTKS